jgi:hypothetical protein
MTGGNELPGFAEQAPPSAAQVLPTDHDPRRRRQRRQAWTFTTLVALVLLVGLVAAGQWMQWWTIGGVPQRTSATPCPRQTTTAPQRVTVNVYNATQTFGLARTVARELQARGFRVATITNDTTGTPIKGVAVIRRGPAGVLAARTLQLQLNGPTTVVDDGRSSRSVDIVVGPAYRAMRPRAVAAKAVAPVPMPTGCVEATAGPTARASTE